MRLVFLILLAPYFALTSATASFAGSGNHGGDGVMITFLKAQPLAAEMVQLYRDHYATDNMSNDSFRTWFAQNVDELTRDVVESPLEPTEEELNHNAMTVLRPRAPIRLSLPSLRNERLNKVQAAALLIHESMHHLGISDEMFAYFGAARISEYWELNHTQDRSNPMISSMDFPYDFGTTQFVKTVMIGYEAFVWNGLESAFIYSPGRNSWRRISISGHLSPRLNPVVLWTGKEVLIWGGVELFSDFSVGSVRTDGVLYDPATDSWRSMTYADAPRHLHPLEYNQNDNRAVWTGTEMIVAGGCFREVPYDADCNFVPTKLYNPELNQWRTASTENHPQLFETQIFWTSDTGHVNTSNKMLAIGVNYDALFKLQLFFFSPTENRWLSQPLPPGTELAERFDRQPKAIWSNNKLTIFSDARLNEHGQFEPSARTVVMTVFDATNDQMSVEFLSRNRFAPVNTNFSCIAVGERIWIQNLVEKVGYLFSPNTLEWRIFDLNRPGIEAFKLNDWTSLTWTGESILNMGIGDRDRIGTIIELQD